MFGVMMSAQEMSQRIFSTISGVMVGSGMPLSPSTGSTTANPPGARQLRMHRAAESICSGEAMKPGIRRRNGGRAFPSGRGCRQAPGWVAQRIVREFHRVRGEHRRGHRATCMPMQDRIRIATVSEVRPKPDMSWIAAILGTGLRIARLREKAWTGRKPFFRRVSLPEPPPFPRLLTFLGRGALLFSEGRSFPYRGGKSRSGNGSKTIFIKRTSVL